MLRLFFLLLLLDLLEQLLFLEILRVLLVVQYLNRLVRCMLVHLIRVLDGKEKPVVTLEIAKKHMDILCKCREVADNSL